ncbi:N-acetyltransferase [Oceanirhabdus seepicola]|uniref:GNAT family N-acetyltransferase n=1 Tax=Oceanirhabdus seepicola TaxID=2828781 RepID=A0A9J6NYU6_9CLOT|nr:GNAT family N-acetyltransferase [Oceanirhabdus seepicola]MCM1988320.1 GNAT family N-acetyltransferase [Oceanirhabdus seepicola]
MAIVTVNTDNIEKEHICCAISDKKGENCVGSKKAWLKERFKDGLVFEKLDERGKVFIEYMPADKAFAPIIADKYMYIDCFWVSGKFKGQGYANVLLDECIEDAKNKGKDGLVVLSSKKKMPFLSDPKYLKYKGFEVCDSAEPYFELLYLPFKKTVKKPQFKDCARKGMINEKGVVLYYSNQCPHTEKYANIIKEVANQRSVNFTLKKITTLKEAQNAPSPFTTYSLFINGKFETNEILSEKKFLKILEAKEM